MTPPDGLALVRVRTLLAAEPELTFPVRPGDRARVVPGEAVDRGAPLADLARDLRTEVAPAGTIRETGGPGDTGIVAAPTGADAPADGQAAAPAAGPRRLLGHPVAELLFRSGGRWRLGVADHVETLEAPVRGIVTEVRPGTRLRIRSAGPAVLGREVLAGPASGRLEVIAPRDGEVRASDIDVGSAGAIVVAGGTIDAEAITRARAVGLRGIVVAALGTKERRDVLASERRGRAAAHGLPPFAILVLDGAVRRPISSPAMAILEALVGHTVAIVGDPPAVVVDGPVTGLPAPDPELVRVVAGPLAGAEGQWVGLAGMRRFSGVVVQEAGFVQLAGRAPIALPLGDLERFA